LTVTVAKSRRSVKGGREAAVHLPLTERLDFRVRVNTSNYLNRVWITILFIINEANYCTIPFAIQFI